ncbi:MAG: hypothetical protein LBK73_03355 [Treponema sp.]|jgi:hypothetical protein|nr:hypothetical protein [Treponema sp.]
MKKFLIVGAALFIGVVAGAWSQQAVQLKLAYNDWGSGSNNQGSLKKQFSAPIKTGDKYQIRIAGVADRDIPILQAVLVDNAAPAYSWKVLSEYPVIGKDIKANAPFDVTFEITATGDGKDVKADQSNMLNIIAAEKDSKAASTRTITIKFSVVTIRKL